MIYFKSIAVFQNVILSNNENHPKMLQRGPLILSEITFVRFVNLLQILGHYDTYHIAPQLCSFFGKVAIGSNSQLALNFRTF
jgi:hypothetical protein